MKHIKLKNTDPSKDINDLLEELKEMVDSYDLDGENRELDLEEEHGRIKCIVIAYLSGRRDERHHIPTRPLAFRKLKPVIKEDLNNKQESP